MINPDCLQGQEFLKKFLPDYEALRGLGYRHHDIMAILGRQRYVVDYMNTPEWIKSAKKLPKGYKWSDGVKYSLMASKKGGGKTYIFLPIAEDLYIKGLLDRAYGVYAEDEEGKSKLYYISNKRIYVIHDWESLTAREVVTGLQDIMFHFLHNCIYDFWHKNGLKTGLIECCLRDLKEDSGNEVHEL